MAKKKKQKNPLPIYIAVMSVIFISILVSVIMGLNSDGQSTRSTQSTVPNVTVPKSDLDPQLFYHEDGFLRYRGADHLLGIDVSAHQGVINWQAVASEEIDFAIIRAGYRGSTVGELYEDEQFRYNLQAAQENGLQVGVYFFSQALNVEEAREEADFVCSLLEGTSLSLPIYFDWEFIGGRVERLGDVPMTECAVAFCERVKELGFEPGVYFNQEFGYYYLDMTKLQDYHLWLAEYNETPTFLYRYDCLQFTDHGNIAGIDTTVDLNILFK